MLVVPVVVFIHIVGIVPHSWVFVFVLILVVGGEGLLVLVVVRLRGALVHTEEVVLAVVACGPLAVYVPPVGADEVLLIEHRVVGAQEPEVTDLLKKELRIITLSVKC